MKYSALLVCPLFLYLSLIIGNGQKKPQVEIALQEDIKEQAFSVLQEKCNVCHSTKKKTDIFTLDNMDSLAANIKKQVFIKRKMPKGRKVKLTEEETKHLKIWLDATVSER